MPDTPPYRTTTIKDALDNLEVPHARTDGLDCITQDGVEALLAPDYLAICSVRADLMACSRYCQGTGCGGHPICRPCYDLGIERGLIEPDASDPSEVPR